LTYGAAVAFEMKDLPYEDLLVETFRSGKKAKFVDGTDTAVRITDKELGIMVQCSYFKSCGQNKNACIDALLIMYEKIRPSGL